MLSVSCHKHQCLHYLFAAMEEFAVADFLKWLMALASILPLGFQKKSGASSFMDARIVVNVGQQPPLVTWCLYYLCISHRRRDGMYHDICTDR